MASCIDSSDSEKGKRRMLQALPEDVEKQWESYLRNEMKFRGDFDLVLPANESERQPTWGQQELYVEHGPGCYNVLEQ